MALKEISLIRNVGNFDSVAPGTQNFLDKLTLIYAENGRGKTTIAEILRSLNSGDPNHIIERSRLGSTNSPHVVLKDFNNQNYIFQYSKWDKILDGIFVFDDIFVSDNICSGLVLDPNHKQKLHEFIIGSEGVKLYRELEHQIKNVSITHEKIKEIELKFPPHDRPDMNIEQFCSLKKIENIQSKIEDVQLKINALKETELIRSTNYLPSILFPHFDINNLEKILLKDIGNLSNDSLSKVQIKIKKLGPNGENWIAQGIKHLAHSNGEVCPFCDQNLLNNELLSNFHEYFSAEYSEFIKSLCTYKDQIKSIFGNSQLLTFEKSIYDLNLKISFWNKFTSLVEVQNKTIEASVIWNELLIQVIEIIENKINTPLEKIIIPMGLRSKISEFNSIYNYYIQLNVEIEKTRFKIDLVKEQAESSNIDTLNYDLSKFKTNQKRHSTFYQNNCNLYLEAIKNKSLAEKMREEARIKLDEYRSSIFPKYESCINEYLGKFNANFRITQVKPQNLSKGSSCNYNVLINDVSINIIEKNTGVPSFKNTLSAGDRNTLALSFFLTAIEQNLEIKDKIIILDDPITSLDEHRSKATCKEILNLSEKGFQVIVLSHSKHFLTYLWKIANSEAKTSLLIARDSVGSTMTKWNIDQDVLSDHEKNYILIENYIKSSLNQNPKEVASVLRPVIERSIRTMYPTFFPSGSLLGNFIQKCKSKLQNDPILNESNIKELEELTEYANKFHHDTNANWQSESISDIELAGHCKRVLKFVSKN